MLRVFMWHQGGMIVEFYMLEITVRKPRGTKTLRLKGTLYKSDFRTVLTQLKNARKNHLYTEIELTISEHDSDLELTKFAFWTYKGIPEEEKIYLTSELSEDILFDYDSIKEAIKSWQ